MEQLRTFYVASVWFCDRVGLPLAVVIYTA